MIDSGPFASRSVTEHWARGLAAFALLAITSEFGKEHELLAQGCGIAALVLLRGCPLCWTVGLYETLRPRLRSARPKLGRDSYRAEGPAGHPAPQLTAAGRSNGAC
jgi:hypothetical protein